MSTRDYGLTPMQVRDELLEIRTRLTQSVAAVAMWRQNGLKDGKVPISVLPIEAKLNHSLREIEACLDYLKYLETLSILTLSE